MHEQDDEVRLRDSTIMQDLQFRHSLPRLAVAPGKMCTLTFHERRRFSPSRENHIGEIETEATDITTLSRHGMRCDMGVLVNLEASSWNCRLGKRGGPP